MLMLTRRRNEQIDLIDKSSGNVFCTISVLEFLPNNVVRLGFEADQSVRIVRDDAKRRHSPEGNGNGTQDEEFDDVEDRATDDDNDTRGNC